jgi:hypothetical protein
MEQLSISSGLHFCLGVGRLSFMIGIPNDPSDFDITQSAAFLLAYYCLITFKKIIGLAAFVEC